MHAVSISVPEQSSSRVEKPFSHATWVFGNASARLCFSFPTASILEVQKSGGQGSGATRITPRCGSGCTVSPLPSENFVTADPSRTARCALADHVGRSPLMPSLSSLQGMFWVRLKGRCLGGFGGLGGPSWGLFCEVRVKGARAWPCPTDTFPKR